MAVLARIPAPILVVILLVLGGCAGTDSTTTDWRTEGTKVFAGQTPNSASNNPENQPEGWGIVLEFFSGPGHLDRAHARRSQVVAAIGRNDVFVRVRPRGSVVVLGSYDGPKNQQAIRDLEMVQDVEVAGRRPYARSYLAPPPPPPADMGDVPELNLLTAKRVAGDRALYTLQVAVFEASRRDRAKRDAEKHAVRLRQQGELAFYFHGPNRSMVTIGIFGEDAYDVEAQRVSPEVHVLQMRFPHNLLNGTDTIPEPPTGRAQPSMLVQVPRE